MKNKYVNRIVKTLGALLGILVITTIIILHFSYVVLSEEGVYQHLLFKKVKINTYLSGSADTLHLPNGYIDGPIVSYHQDGSKTAVWFQNNEVHEKKLGALESRFQVLSSEGISSFELFPIKKAVTTFEEKPQEIVFISDHHGDYDYFRTVLTRLNVIDEQGNWTYGQNHLVIAGDMVDRGVGVHKILWDIVKLSRQAENSNGRVHFLVGNHEQYIMKGLFSRVNPLNLYSLQQLMEFKEVFSKKTYLGQWLRSRPVIINIDGILVTHGGISPQTLAKHYSVNELNEIMWNYWENDNIADSLKEVVLGHSGVTQYRGYIMEDGEFSKANEEELVNICAYYEAETIVVGHTDVPSTIPLYEGKVYDINSITSSSEILVFKDGQMQLVDIGIVKSDYKSDTYTRRFDVTHLNDWKMIFSTFQNLSALSKVKHPY